MRLKKWILFAAVMLLTGGFLFPAAAFAEEGGISSGEGRFVICSNQVKLSRTEKTLYAGKTFQLKISGPSDMQVTWYSLNPSVATVDDKGLVKGMVGGSTKIVANVSGNEFECSVTVKEKEVTSISIKGVSGKHFPGETIPLTAKLSPNGAKKADITWKSRQTGVAAVSDKGVVTLVAAGKAEIEASVKTSVRTVTKVYKINVKAPFLKLNKKSLSLKNGAVGQLSVKYCSGAAVTCSWSSENKEVAVVDSTGKVTATGTGTAYITAKYGTVEAKCRVKVKSALSKITLSDTKVTIAPEGTIQLKVTFTPNLTTKPAVTWTSKNPAVALVDSLGNVKGIAEGKTTITAEAEGKKKTCTVYVKNVLTKQLKRTATKNNTKKWTGILADGAMNSIMGFKDGKTKEFSGLQEAQTSGEGLLLGDKIKIVYKRVKGMNVIKKVKVLERAESFEAVITDQAMNTAYMTLPDGSTKKMGVIDCYVAEGVLMDKSVTVYYLPSNPDSAVLMY